MAHGLEARIGMIRPDVRGLHAGVAVLAIGDGVPGKSAHKTHFPQSAAGIFDKPIFRVKFLNQIQYMNVNIIAKLSVLRNRGKIAVRFLFSVVRNSGNTICGTIRGRPNDIGAAKALKNFLSGQGPHVGIKVDARKPLIPFNAVNFMPPRWKALPIERVPANSSKTLISVASF